MVRSWVEINLKILRENIRNLKKYLSDKTLIMGIVKADAYGHGMLKVAEVMRSEGIKNFGVATLEEGIDLRKSCTENESILVLGYTPFDEYEGLLEYNIKPTIFSFEQAKILNELAKKHNKKVTIHIKIDTGMGRIGFIPNETSLNEIKKISELPYIDIEGVFSHLAVADQLENSFSREQFLSFKNFLCLLEKNKIKIPVKHIANSAAILNFPEMHLDLVRPGIILYGLYPAPEMAKNSPLKIKPIMAIKSQISHVKKVPKGTPISYSCTFVTKKESIIATVPLGYADGIFRLLSNRGEVLVKGKRCPIVGNICMDQFMIDATEVEGIMTGDEVVFVGTQGAEEITADEIAEKIGTISYEIISRIGKRLPKIYV